jgi:putative zinc finger/helix-turn-helix YgiT family protein
MPKAPRRRPPGPTVCPACGDERAQVVQRQEQINEPDVEGEFRFDITACEACGEEILSFDQAEAQARAYAAAVARARNTMTPERIHELRQSLGWSQPQMEDAFGVGPKTWGRWERGTVAPTGPAARLMWLADVDRAEFLRLVEAHQRRPIRQANVAGTIMPQGIGESAIAFRVANGGARRHAQLAVNGAVNTVADSGIGV